MEVTRAAAGRAPAIIFAVTLFASSAVLFLIQPLFTRLVLPTLGGAPAVWTTAMLFFQTLLIAGYFYAHLLSRILAPRWQLAAHLCLWALAIWTLPIGTPDGWRFDAGRSLPLQTLGQFAVGVGLPFFALSANAPLLQHWFARSGVSGAENPYVLYGASNLGSFAALLAFPLLAEPLLGVSLLAAGWSWAFALLALPLAACVFGAPALLRQGAARLVPRDLRHAPAWVQRAVWLGLAFVPSSLMLVTTSRIATDVGSLPLVWVLPLALYLLTYVITFRDLPARAETALRIGGLAGLAVLVVGLGGYGGAHLGPLGALALILGFFLAALAVHRRLYLARPHPDWLTGFYLAMSIGGALGGLFNSLLAPMVFDRLHEGPITVVALALALAAGPLRPGRPLALAILGAVAMFVLVRAGHALPAGALAGLALLIALTCLWRLAAKGAAPALFVALAVFFGISAEGGDERLTARSFFGTHKVVDQDGIRLYANGTTLHGSQRVAEDGTLSLDPLAYYHERAPMGQIMLSDRGATARRIGVVGLGVGALACHGRPQQSWEFYEIDPKVLQIARHSGQFGFLSNCAPDAPVHLGDARIVLQQHRDRTFDILVIDAYSSDAVPVHLTTREALQLYMARLAPGGLLVMHVSNRYFDLEAPIGDLAADLGLAARIQDYAGSGDAALGDRASVVIALARDAAGLGPIAQDGRWRALRPGGARPWTDDYANPLSSLKIFTKRAM